MPRCSSHESHGALGCVGRTQLLDGHWHLPDNRELHIALVHFCYMVTLALACLEHRGVDNLDRAWFRTVTTSHLRVQLAHCAIDGHITELLVHVVGVCTAFVA